MTVLEALKQAVETLNGISIPISMMNQVGFPVNKAISLIQASLDAFEESKQNEEDGGGLIGG